MGRRVMQRPFYLLTPLQLTDGKLEYITFFINFACNVTIARL